MLKQVQHDTSSILNTLGHPDKGQDLKYLLYLIK